MKFTITAEQRRDPYDSNITLVRHEDAADCFGEECGNYYEENGSAIKPLPHSHLIVAGQDPVVAPRRYLISK